MTTPDLKPCQAAARGTICWKDDWQQNYFVCRVDCKEADRHVEARVSQECIDGLVESITEQDVMRELCKGCKEANRDADGVGMDNN